MRNIFIARNQIADRWSKISSLPYVSITTFEEEEGIIVYQDNETTLMEEIGVTSYELQPTSLEGIYLAAINGIAPKRQFNIYFKDNGCYKHNKDKIKEILKTHIKPLVQGHINVRVPHQNRMNPVDEGAFNVYIWSQLESTPTPDVSTPSEIWGLPVSCRDYSYPSSGKGYSIDDGDYSVAELIGNTLYIHHDIVEEGNDHELVLFEEIIKRAAALLNLSPEEKAQRDAEIAERERRRKVEMFVSKCNEVYDKELKVSIDKIKSIENDIRTYQNEVVKKMRELNVKRLTVDRLQEVEADRRTRFEHDYYQILNLDKVIDVEVNKEKIDVFTEVLYCVDPETNMRHEIGKFRIEIPFFGSSPKWFNLDREITGWNGHKQYAPHVWATGQACLGTAVETFPELFAALDYVPIVVVAIQFIESVDITDGAGRKLKRFPEAPLPDQEISAPEETVSPIVNVHTTPDMIHYDLEGIPVEGTAEVIIDTVVPFGADGIAETTVTAMEEWTEDDDDPFDHEEESTAWHRITGTEPI